MLGAAGSLDKGQQGGALVAGGSRIPRFPGPAGEAAPGVQGVRVLGAAGSLDKEQQGGALVAGGGRIPRFPGPAGEAAPGVQGVRVLGATDPLLEGQQGGELVAGGGRIPRLPGPAGEAAPGVQGVRVLGATDLLLQGQQGGELVAGGSRIPRFPGPAGETTRAFKVPGSSGPQTFSWRGSRAANWSRAAAASPASPVQLTELMAGYQDVRVLGAEDLLLEGQQGGAIGRGRRPDPPPSR